MSAYLGATLTGFSPARVEGIVLRLGQILIIDLALEVGLASLGDQHVRDVVAPIVGAVDFLEPAEHLEVVRHGRQELGRLLEEGVEPGLRDPLRAREEFQVARTGLGIHPLLAADLRESPEAVKVVGIVAQDLLADGDGIVEQTGLAVLGGRGQEVLDRLPGVTASPASRS